MPSLHRSTALLVALGLVSVAGVLGAACGSSVTLPPNAIDPESGVPPTAPDASSDGGADGALDAAADGPASDAADSGANDAGVDAEPTDQTVGDTCVFNTDCEKVAPADKICTLQGFATGSINPTPVCIGVSCVIDNPGGVSPCDGTRGACVLGGVCMPVCTFDSTKMTKACAGKNLCNPHRFTGGGPAPLTGVGYCYRGCRVDLDCPGGELCQRETGECVAAKTVFTKPVGAACTKADDGVACHCRYSDAAGANLEKGYCTTFCAVGEACTVGYQCTGELPSGFTGEPKGLAGACLKTCAVDGDCTGLSSRCRLVAGAKRVCVPAN